MIKARLYQVIITNLCHKLRAIYSFFASQRSYGYALSQEKQYLAPNYAPQIQRGRHD